MSQYTNIKCDECGREVEERSCIGWVRTSRIGLESRTYADRPIEADLCSYPCLMKYMRYTTLNNLAIDR